MKIKDGFLLREVAGNYIVIAVGEDSENFNNIITINELGAFIWNRINEGKGIEEIADDITGEYSVEREVAVNDINDFVNQLAEVNVIEK